MVGAGAAGARERAPSSAQLTERQVKEEYGHQMGNRGYSRSSWNLGRVIIPGVTQSGTAARRRGPGCDHKPYAS